MVANLPEIGEKGVALHHNGTRFSGTQWHAARLSETVNMRMVANLPETR